LLLAHELSDWIGKEIHGKGLEAASKNWNFFLGVFLSSFSLSHHLYVDVMQMEKKANIRNNLRLCHVIKKGEKENKILWKIH
jgi:hypothetical protein